LDVTFTDQKINLAFNYKDLPHSLTYTLLLSKGKSTLITEVQCIKSDLSLVNAILMLEPVYLEYLDIKQTKNGWKYYVTITALPNKSAVPL
jgi:hypothetical protein